MSAAQFTDATFHRISAALAAVGVYAAERGVCVAMENHGASPPPAQCRRLLSEAAAGMPGRVARLLGLNYDPANFRHEGEDALAALMVTGDLTELLA